jgi:hypothetical protein
MTTALDNLVSQADEAARNTGPAPSTALTPSAPTGGSLAKPNLDSFIDGGGMDVDYYVRLNDTGIRFGDKQQGVFDEFVATIDMSEITPMHCFRVEVGGNTRFIKSYDGVTTADGMSFQQAIASAERQPGAKTSGIYPTCEIPMVLTESMSDPKKGSDVTFEEGTKIGYTPSVTGFKPFQKFCKDLRSRNPALLQSEVTVKVKHAVRVNANNNRWGVLEFELIEG